MNVYHHRILFTGGGGAASEAFFRLLKNNYEVFFADADINTISPSIPIERRHSIPLASSPNFLFQLRELCTDLSIDLLVPGVDEELLQLGDKRTTFPCQILLPSTDFIDTHLDKQRSIQLLQENGLPTPLTTALQNVSSIGFPCIIKPRTGRGSQDVRIVYSKDDLAAHLTLARRPPESFIAQQLLLGQEYTVMVSANSHGALRAVVPVKVDIKRGITIRAETEKNNTVIEACTAIHNSSPVSGCYNIQLMLTPDGTALPFEINPRISTTTCLGLAAGIDFANIFLNDNRTNSFLLPFTEGLRLRRNWHNHFLNPSNNDAS